MYNFHSRNIDIIDSPMYKFNSDTFLKVRVQWSELFRLMEKLIVEIYSKKDKEKFKELLLILYVYTTEMRSEQYYAKAIRIYEFFLYKAPEKGRFYPGFEEFHETLDFTEVYYNLGFLNYEQGDFDLSMYYFAIADEIYCKQNRLSNGELLISLIDKNGSPFWSFSSHLCQNCAGNSSFDKDFGFNAVFGKKMNETEVKFLLDDFNSILLLQFVMSIERFWKVFSLKFNVVKALRINRFLGELVWLLEAYLKEKSGKTSEEIVFLSETIKIAFKNDRQLKKKYYELRNTTEHMGINEKIIYLTGILKNNNNVIDKKAACLVVSYYFRNFTAHNLSDTFILFKDNSYNKKIFFCLLWTFFIVYYEVPK
jgi:tetratricopeptide (TPR) repeat protein